MYDLYPLMAIQGREQILFDFHFRFLYWTDVSGTHPKIERAWTTGDKRTVLVSSKLGRPTSIAIDFFMGDRVYWCDAKENVIESMKADGSDRVVVTAKSKKFNNLFMLTN